MFPGNAGQSINAQTDVDRFWFIMGVLLGKVGRSYQGVLRLPAINAARYLQFFLRFEISQLTRR